MHNKSNLKLRQAGFFKFRKALSLNVSGDLIHEQSWNTGYIKDKQTKFYNRDENLVISLRNYQNSPIYIFYKGSASDLKKIGVNNGLEVNPNKKYLLGFDCDNDRRLHVTLCIKEFNEDLLPLETSFNFSKNKIHEYVPSEFCFKFLVFFQIKGIGRVSIKAFNLSIKENILFEDFKDSKELAKSIFNNESKDLSYAFNHFDTDKLFVPLNEANDYINNLNSDHSQILYKWKRRAAGWKKKYENVDSAKNFDNSLTYEVFSNLAKQVPLSNGVQYFEKLNYNIGIIADPHMFNFYKDAFTNVHYLSPVNYENILKAEKLDFIIYCTGWRGLDNEEWRGIKFREKPKNAFNSIVKFAKENRIKLVFQSTEDPSNFEYFLPIASNFDYIFTTAEECIDDYADKLGHNNIFYGEYGVSPFFNNPVGSRKITLDNYFFAGSWATRYNERCNDGELILDSIKNSKEKLFIADRNFGTDKHDHIFPDRFHSFILPKFEHDLLQHVHKLFRYNINLNSIKYSSTMCAMRVYQLLAMGVSVISNYSKSVYNNFPEIRIINSETNLCNKKFDHHEISTQEYRRNMRAVRFLFNNKTVFHSAHNLLDKIGLKPKPLVESQICVIYNSSNNKKVQELFNNQRYSHKILMNESEIKNEKNWKDLINSKNIRYFTWFDDENDYEKYYLNDLINAFKYTDCCFVTKDSYFDKNGKFCRGLEHDFTYNIKSKYRTLFSVDHFSYEELFKNKISNLMDTSKMGYSIDPFELNYLHSRKLNSLSSAIGHKAFNLSVIVPVFNNGRFLINKCFSSLLMNECFPKMEIILVDDSSTDLETLDILDMLDREFSNVKVLKLKGPPSGSASLPRNRGMEMANADLITFLDPDNEISVQGYDKLISIYNEFGTVPIVSGYHLKIGLEVKEIARRSDDRDVLINNPKNEFLLKGKFPVIPTQPAVINANFLKTNNIKFVENAVGQDTLFGWEIISKAAQIVFTSKANIVYYSDRIGSVVNDIDANYFNKKYIIEKIQVEFLRREGIFDAYLKHHYDNFMNNWYFKKLDLIKDEMEKNKCIEIITEIAHLYNDKSISRKLSDLVN